MNNKFIDTPKKKLKRQFISIIIIGLIGILLGILLFMLIKDDKEKSETTPPSLDYVEEELESRFITTGLYVHYGCLAEEDYMVYFVEDLGRENYYIVGYTLNKKQSIPPFVTFKWEYFTHILVEKEIFEKEKNHYIEIRKEG